MQPTASSEPPADAEADDDAPSWTDRLEYLVVRVVFGAFALLPRSAALAVGAGIGELIYRLPLKQRAVAQFNLRLAFPERGDAERDAILRQSCRNLGRILAECAHFPTLTRENIGRYVVPEDRERWQRALDDAARRGTVVLTGHVGNFELLAHAQGLLGYPITLVHRPMRNPLVEAAILGLRAPAGTVSLEKKSAAKAALRALHRHATVAIPADQNQTRRYGVFVDFFGTPACTTPGPARLAMLSKAPIVPVFLVRDGESDRHRILVLADVEPVSTGDREADVVATTRRCNAVIEDVLRRYPEQWIWFHKRWKTRPLGEPRLY